MDKLPAKPTSREEAKDWARRAAQQEAIISRGVYDRVRTMDSRFRDVAPWMPLVHTPQGTLPEPHGMTRELHAELVAIEGGQFAISAYEEFSWEARDIIARRHMVVEDSAALVEMVSTGVTPRGAANGLGFSSVAMMRRWARKMDAVYGTDIEEAVTSLRQVYADVADEMAHQMLDGLGMLTHADGRTLSLTDVAFDFEDAAEANDVDAMYALAQKVPVYEKAIAVSDARRTKLADYFQKKAKAFNPAMYNPSPTTQGAGAGAVQHVSIMMDMGQAGAPAPVRTHVVNAPVAPAGIVMDMGAPAEDEVVIDDIPDSAVDGGTDAG